MKSKFTKFLWFVFIFVPLSADAVNDSDYAMINFTGGVISPLDGVPVNAATFGLEYRSNKKGRWHLAPSYGYTWSDNGSQYAYADLKRDWGFKENLVFTMGFGVGLFDNSEVLDLGHVVEFRTSFELTYKLKNDYRLGLAAIHISNSKLGDENPGTERFVASVLIPIGKK